MSLENMEERAAITYVACEIVRRACQVALEHQLTFITCSVEEDQDGIGISLTLPTSSAPAARATTGSKPTEEKQ